MKKYKLIKEYPGSYKIGYTTIQVEPCPSYSNYPEFWELVVEKDYEILSLKSHMHNYGIKQFIDGILDCNNVIPITIDIALNLWVNKLQNHSIHSVKRLSDGEIFTIGDKTNGGSIKEIWLSGLTISNIKQPDFIHIVYNHDLKGSIYPNFNNIQKVKQPLFTTEDAVEVFEGDSFHIVHNTNWNNIKCTAQKNATFSIDSTKKFSSKEKAEEYIIMNKPCLSLNDVAKVYVSAGFEITDKNRNSPHVKQQIKLREIIKNKLKI